MRQELRKHNAFLNVEFVVLKNLRLEALLVELRFHCMRSLPSLGHVLTSNFALFKS